MVTLTGSLVGGGGGPVLGRQFLVPAGDAVVGAIGGWVVTGQDNGLAELPANQSNSTLVIPLKGLHIGDTLTGVTLTGHIESNGNIGTLSLEVRKATQQPNLVQDVQLGIAASGNITTDTLIASTGTPVAVTGLTEVLAETELLYVIITGTTGAVVDIVVSDVIVTVDQA